MMANLIKLFLTILFICFGIDNVQAQPDDESTSQQSFIKSTLPSTTPEYLVEETEDPNASNYVDYLSTVGDYDNVQPENSGRTDESATDYGDSVSLLFSNCSY